MSRLQTYRVRMMAHQGIGQCSTLDEMLVGTCASGAASGLQVDFVDCWSFREMAPALVTATFSRMQSDSRCRKQGLHL